MDCIRLTYLFWQRRSRIFFTPGINIPLYWPDDVIVVPTIHDLIPVRVAEESSSLKRLYFSTILKPGCARVPCIFTVSEFSRQEVAAWAGIDISRIVNVGNGVSQSFSPSGACWMPGYPYILYVGNHRPHKNIPLLLRAFARLESSNICLALTGDPCAPIVDMIGRLGIHGRVKFLGNLDEKRLAETYRGAVALVMPSNYEGFGLPVIEAMACGTPVVSSDATALPEVVGSAGILVAAGNEDALAAGIDRIIADSSLRAGLAARGLSHSAQFTWDAVATKIQDTLNQLLNAAA